jgi:exodeoxyribonuclease VII large subunit
VVAVSAPKIWTVADLTRYVRGLLEGDRALRSVWLRGEISNWSRAASGHAYFTLKDPRAAIKCVMWRSSASSLKWQPRNGDAAVAHGRISVYPPQGVYQLQIDELRPAGVGDLHAQFEALRERLREEGLFEAARKQALSPFPQVIGVVTSPQAAAYRDVLNVLPRRFPLVRVLLAPTLVQGDQAPRQIVAALRHLDARDDVDVLLVVRGGGSIEELWAFNDETVARTIAACRHPVVCGVGHETDFTIADFVADVRAPTPSAAAELVVRDQAELRERIAAWSGRMRAAAQRHLAGERSLVEAQARTLHRLSPRAQIETGRQKVDELDRRGARALAHGLALRRSQLVGLEARLSALSPRATLERGYAIVRRVKDDAVVRSVVQVGEGDELRVEVRDGAFDAIAGRQE